MAWKLSFRQNYRTTFSPTVPPSATGISHVVADVEVPGGEKCEHLKSGGEQWQATPKNLPRMQRTRAIPVAWLNSGLCPDRPKGWIPIIIIIYIRDLRTRIWCLHLLRQSLVWLELNLRSLIYLHGGHRDSTQCYLVIRHDTLTFIFNCAMIA